MASCLACRPACLAGSLAARLWGYWLTIPRLRQTHPPPTACLPAWPADFKRQATLDAFNGATLSALENASKYELQLQGDVIGEDKEEQEAGSSDASGRGSNSSGSSVLEGQDAIDLAALLDGGLGARVDAAAAERAAIAATEGAAMVAAAEEMERLMEAAQAAINSAGQAGLEVTALMTRRNEAVLAAARALDPYASDEAKQLIQQASAAVAEVQAAGINCIEGPCQQAVAASKAVSAAADQLVAATDDAGRAAALEALRQANEEAQVASCNAAGWLMQAQAKASRLEPLLGAALALPVPQQAPGSGGSSSRGSSGSTSLLEIEARLGAAAAADRQAAAAAASPLALVASALEQFEAGLQQPANRQQQQQQQGAGSTDLPSAVLAAAAGRSGSGSGGGTSPQQQSSVLIDVAAAAAAAEARVQADGSAGSGNGSEPAQPLNEAAVERLLLALQQAVESNSTTPEAIKAAEAAWQQRQAEEEEELRPPPPQQQQQKAD